MAEITAKQEKAIAALIAEQTIRDAAAKSGMTEQTLFRWLKDESFNAEYMRARRDAVQQAVARMQSATCEAVEALRDVMNDETSKGTQRKP